MTIYPGFHFADEGTSSRFESLPDEDTAHHSPQWFNHDHTADLPELRVDPFANAPEVHYLSHPESAIESPIALSYQDPESEKEPIAQVSEVHENQPPPTRSIWFRRRRLLIALLVILVIIAAGLGAGLGITLGQKADSTSTASATAQPSQTATSSISSALATSTSLPGVVADDSSLAAVTVSNGDRYLFFQDNTGAIRQAYYAKNSVAWTAQNAAQYVVANDTRKNTPIAAFATAKTVAVFFVYANNTIGLASSSQSISGWSHDVQYSGVIDGFEVAPESRSLSVNHIAPSGDVDDGGLVLMLERGETGNVSLIYCPGIYQRSAPNISMGIDTDKIGTGGVIYSNPTVLAGLPWIDLSANLNSSLTAKPTTPFTLGMTYQWVLDNSNDQISDETAIGPVFLEQSGSQYDVHQATFFSNGTVQAGILPDMYLEEVTSNVTVGSDTISEFVTPWIWRAQPYDFANGSSFDRWVPAPNGIFWVNSSDSKLVISNYTSGPGETMVTAIPSSSFPFSRLAVTTAQNDTSFYLYHQVSDTVIMEESWSQQGSIWITPVNITIET